MYIVCAAQLGLLSIPSCVAVVAMLFGRDTDLCPMCYLTRISLVYSSEWRDSHSVDGKPITHSLRLTLNRCVRIRESPSRCSTASRRHALPLNNIIVR